LVLANVLVRAGSPAEALEHYPRASALGVRHPGHLYTSWGVALYRAGRLAQAEAVLRRAVKKNANLAEAHANLGLVLAAQGRTQEAVQALRRAAALAPDRTWISRQLHRLENRRGRNQPCLQDEASLPTGQDGH
jgi:Flp pilus assembly protein TadD